MHNGALLAQEARDLRQFNEKKRQKRTRSNRQISRQQDPTVGESISLVSTLPASVEAIQNDDAELAQQPTIGAEPTTKRVFRCSGCGNIGHKINQCNTR